MRRKETLAEIDNTIAILKQVRALLSVIKRPEIAAPIKTKRNVTPEDSKRIQRAVIRGWAAHKAAVAAKSPYVTFADFRI